MSTQKTCFQTFSHLPQYYATTYVKYLDFIFFIHYFFPCFSLSVFDRHGNNTFMAFCCSSLSQKKKGNTHLAILCIFIHFIHLFTYFDMDICCTAGVDLKFCVSYVGCNNDDVIIVIPHIQHKDCIEYSLQQN